MAAPLPINLKAIQPYLKVANDMRKKDTVTAYYCDLHAMQNGMKIDSKSPDCKKFLIQLMTSLEKQKGDLSVDPDIKEAVTSEIVGQTIIENQAMKLFGWADTKDRNSEFNKNVVRAFYTASVLFDVAEGLGELGDEARHHRKYARWKATYIHNCLKNGEIPQPGPIAGLDDEWEGEGEEEDQSAGASGYEAGPSTSQMPPSNYTEPPKPAARNKPPELPASTPAPAASSYQEPAQLPSYQEPASSSGGGVELSAIQYNQAQKLCKYASSAIMYQDVPTALLNLEKCMRLLKTGKEDP